MRHGYPTPARNGRVHGIPLGSGNVRSLCGMLPTSGVLNPGAGDPGRWYSTTEEIDCHRCIRRLETIAADAIERDQAQTWARDFDRRTSRAGVCSSCGRVRAVKQDDTIATHKHKTNQAWKTDDVCRGAGKPPKYWVVPYETEART